MSQKTNIYVAKYKDLLISRKKLSCFSDLIIPNKKLEKAENGSSNFFSEDSYPFCHVYRASQYLYFKFSHKSESKHFMIETRILKRG